MRSSPKTSRNRQISPDPGSCWTLSYLESDLACLSLDTPDKRVNVLTSDSLEQLDQLLDRLDAQSHLAGLVIASGKPGHFADAADSHALCDLGQPADPAEVGERTARGQSVLARLAAAHYVTVAAIDGACRGGGAELVCWCDRRVASDGKTEFGFPEVQLGLIPGWGATARLPRLVGLAAAVDLITTGRAVDAAQAQAIGLADELVPRERMFPVAVAMIRADRQSGQLSAHRQRLAAPPAIDPAEVARLTSCAEQSIAESWRGRQPAPTAALKLLLEGLHSDVPTACRQASAVFRQLFGSPVHRALTNVVSLKRHNEQNETLPADFAARPIPRLGVIGAGIMGIGVAVANVRHGIPVCLADASPEALTRGLAAVLDEVSHGSRQQDRDAGLAARLAGLITRADSVEALADCDLIIESIVENAGVKRRLYQRLEPILEADTVLASNTSTISISSLASCLERPQRFCGMHFFNPVRLTRLIEIVRGGQTSQRTIAAAVAYAQQLGRMPVVVNDGPGFLVNRLLTPYLNEALELLCAGAPIEQIDGAAEQFGMPLGPLALYDLIGIDTAFYAGRTMWEAFPERIAALPVLPSLLRKGRLGQKSGVGFYRYGADAQPRQPDPQTVALLEPYVRRKRELSPREITERLLLPVVLEATRVLAAGIVHDVRDVDLGMIYALGFPPDRGGLLFWADTLGAAGILEMLQPYQSLGPRFRPTDPLLEMARQGRQFYDPVRRSVSSQGAAP